MEVSVFTSSIINADVEKLWDKVKDFNGLPNWYPGVIESFIEGDTPNTKVGAIRNFKRSDGLSFREVLVVFDDSEHKFTYSLLKPLEPMVDYICTLRLLPVTDGNSSYIEWSASFKCSEEEKHKLCSDLEQVFQNGFDALKRVFKS